ncbi:MAG: type II toxin-antitoxin system RelE/ParE family toxin [Planctomycetes bacterium]|nr:type II toxin-antitoxin system RelE/ParE family toxin [Planctomycetota bacterium]
MTVASYEEKKISGDFRVGDYRIVYSIEDMESTVDIIAVRHRREAYR